MSGIPDVTSVGPIIVGACDYWPPRAILIIGKVDSICSLSTGGQPRRLHYFVTDHISVTIKVPAIDHVANGLLFLWVGGAAVYFHGTVVITNRLLGQKWHKYLVPGLSCPACRPTRNMHIPFLCVQVGGQANLTQVAPADNILSLLTSFSQSRHHYCHKYRNDGNHHQKFYQRKPAIRPADKSILPAHNHTLPFYCDSCVPR
jgi:hypothetical protein